MLLLLISLFTACVAGIIIISYEFFAYSHGWPVGKLFKNNIFRFLFGGLSIIGSVWFAISYLSLLLGIGVFIIGWIMAFLITIITKSYVQWVAIALLITSYVLQFFF